ADMLDVCGQYARLHAGYKLATDLVRFDGVLMRIRDKVVQPGDSVLTGSVIDTYEQDGSPTACRTAAAAAKARDPVMVIKTGTATYTIAEYETKVCDELATLHPPFIAAARAELRKAIEKTMAPYVA